MVFSFLGAMHMRQVGVFYKFLPLQVRHERFSFYCLRNSDEKISTDLMYDFGLPNLKGNRACLIESHTALFQDSRATRSMIAY